MTIDVATKSKSKRAFNTLSADAWSPCPENSPRIPTAFRQCRCRRRSREEFSAVERNYRVAWPRENLGHFRHAEICAGGDP